MGRIRDYALVALGWSPKVGLRGKSGLPERCLKTTEFELNEPAAPS